MARVLLLGGDGMLGSALWRVLAPAHAVTAPARAGFDILADAWRALPLDGCDWVLNAAGVINRRDAEAPALTMVNANFPHALAALCATAGARLIHFSTDCVFAGTAGPYDEAAACDAADAYGRSKAAGEPAGALVLRTSIVGPETRRFYNLLCWTLRQTRIDGFLNHRWNGVTTLALAEAVQRLIAAEAWQPGVRHVFATDTTKHGLIAAILPRFGGGAALHGAQAEAPRDTRLRTRHPAFLAQLGLPPLAEQLDALAQVTGPGGQVARRMTVMEAAAPAISVVLPTYNHLRFLPAAVADILAQTRPDWELIVVNDGSTDATAAWLDSQDEPRLRVIHQDNAGPDAAINAGIAAARGAYLTWVSADNRCAPFFLEALAAPLDLDAGCALAYSPYYAIDANDRVQGIKFDNLLLLRELVTGTPRGMAGFLYRRALHDVVGLYHGYACDTAMWSRIAEAFDSVFVLEPTYSYRFHDDRATVREGGRVEMERAAIATGFLSRHGGSVDEAVLRRLYPGLARAPGLAADAAADFAARLTRCGQADAGLRVALTAVAAAEAPALLRPLLNAVGAALRAGTDPLADLCTMLDYNLALTTAQRDTALSIAAGLLVLAQQGGGAPSLLLEMGHALAVLERPKVFSYTAWKAGAGAPPVPAF